MNRYLSLSPIPLLALVAMLVMTCGCKPGDVDMTSPEAAYESFRAHLLRGDWEGVFPLMIPEVKDNITRTWQMNRKTAGLIESSIPAALKQNYLSEIGSAEVRNAQSPEQYFGALMRSAFPVSLVPGDSRHSVETSISRISETRKGSRNYVVTTIAGRQINLVLNQDNTYGIEPPEDQARLFRMNYKAASELYINVKAVVDSLDQETGKAPR